MILPFRRLAGALLALLLGVAALPAPAAAQATDTVAAAAQDTLYEIRLTDRSVLYGRVVEETGGQVVVRTQAGAVVTLDRSQVASIAPARGRVVNGQLWEEDPHATRLFFGPTARTLPQGEGYFGVFELFFPFVAYGITDRLTVSAGLPVAPGIIGKVVYLAPKYEVVRTPSASAAVGVLALFSTAAVDGGSVGLLYGVGTFGSPDAALTAGATVPFQAGGDNDGFGDRPVFMLGGEARVGRSTKLTTENYLFPHGALVSGGLRIFGGGLSADVGLGRAFGEKEQTRCCLPLVNFIYGF